MPKKRRIQIPKFDNGIDSFRKAKAIGGVTASISDPTDMYVASIDVVGTGNGTIIGASVNNEYTNEGQIDAICTDIGTPAEFDVTNANNDFLGVAIAGTEFVHEEVTFTITVGGVAWAVDDLLTIHAVDRSWLPYHTSAEFSAKSLGNVIIGTTVGDHLTQQQKAPLVMTGETTEPYVSTRSTVAAPTITGTVTRQDSIKPTHAAGAFSFAGSTGDYFDFDSNSAFDLSNGEAIIDMWFYRNTTGEDRGLFDWSQGTDTRFKGGVNTSNELIVTIDGTTATKTSIAASTWYHLVIIATKQGSKYGVWQCFLDDTQFGTNITSTNAIIHKSSGIWIGQYDSSIKPWNGYISCIRFWNFINVYVVGLGIINGKDEKPISFITNNLLVRLNNELYPLKNTKGMYCSSSETIEIQGKIHTEGKSSPEYKPIQFSLRKRNIGNYEEIDYLTILNGGSEGAGPTTGTNPVISARNGQPGIQYGESGGGGGGMNWTNWSGSRGAKGSAGGGGRAAFGGWNGSDADEDYVYAGYRCSNGSAPIIITARTIIGNGLISTNGIAGQAGIRSSGGGGGGAVILLAEINNFTGTITANGGTGGYDSYYPTVFSGDGGSGFIFSGQLGVDYP